MENDFFQSKLGLVLRWLLFLPTALLAALITGFVVRLAQASTGSVSIIAASAMSASAFMFCILVIVPRWKMTFLWFFFIVRLIMTVIWFTDPSSSELALFGLIIQEVTTLGFLLYIILGIAKDNVQ